MPVSFIVRALCGSFFATLLSMFAGCAIPTSAHEGHSHTKTLAPASPASSPRVAASSDRYEFVGIAQGHELWFYVDRFDTNQPVTDVAVTVTIGDAAEVRNAGIGAVGSVAASRARPLAAASTLLMSFGMVALLIGTACGGPSHDRAGYGFGLCFLLAIGMLGPSQEAAAGPHDHDAMEREAHAKFHERRAVRFFRERRFNAAATEFSYVIELKPKAVAPFFLRANAHFRNRNFEQALADFDEAIRLYPSFTVARANRANTLTALGRLDEAVSEFGAALAQEPDNTYVLFNRGFAYGKQGEYAKAIADFTRVVELEPNDAKAWRLRAAAYGALGMTDKATADLLRARMLGSGRKPER